MGSLTISMIHLMISILLLFFLISNTSAWTAAQGPASCKLSLWSSATTSSTQLRSSNSANNDKKEEDVDNVFSKFGGDIISFGKKAFQQDEQRRTFTLGRLLNDDDDDGDGSSTKYYKTRSKKRIKQRKEDSADIYSILANTKVLDPKTGKLCRPLDGDSTSSFIIIWIVYSI